MNNKKTLWSILIASIPVFIIGFIPLFPEFFGLCKNSFDFDCLDRFRDSHIFYLAYLTIIAPLMFVSCAVLLFRLQSNEIFQSWKKFAKWYLGIVAGIFLFFAFSDGGGGLFGDRLGYIIITILLSIIFVIISAVIIVRKSRKLRGK